MLSDQIKNGVERAPNRSLLYALGLTEEEISYFRDMVVRVADQVGSIKTRPDRLDSIGREALNKRIGTFMCPYRLARGAWRIERAVEATEA